MKDSDSMSFKPKELDYRQLVRDSRNLDTSLLTQNVRIAILSDAASQQFVPLLRVLFHKSSVAAEVYEGGFAGFELQVLNPASALYAFQPDVIVLANCMQGLRKRYYESGGDPEFVSSTVEGMTGIWTAIQANSSARIIQFTFAMPYERMFGHFDLRVPQSLYAATIALNARIVESATAFDNVLLCDVEAIASFVGRRLWFDERLWQVAKTFCHLDCLPRVCHAVVSIVLPTLGRIVKCVIVDLDNTLWGGTVGDAGHLGITVGSSGDGEPFYLFQHFLLSLKRRGILLAVCSKNDLDKALRPFDDNPNMVLRREDITVFIANWDNKAQNIMQIRETLDIGLGSIVFIDDNPFERNLVRQFLPELIVPEMPADPSEFVAVICELGLFEVSSFSTTDANRAELYRIEATRREYKKAFVDVDAYLRSLEMKIEVARFTDPQLTRISQLLQRSNQFNLTTNRYSEAECRRLMLDSGQCIPLCASLRDRFGDHGLIAIVIVRCEEDRFEITDWLMSCRVMARGVEAFLMTYLVGIAKERRIHKIYGEYVPTAKNGIVKEFYARFGFEKISEMNERSRWCLLLESYKPETVFIVDAAMPES